MDYHKNLIVCPICGHAVANNGSMRHVRASMIDTCKVTHKPKPSEWIVKHNIKPFTTF